VARPEVRWSLGRGPKAASADSWLLVETVEATISLAELLNGWAGLGSPWPVGVEQRPALTRPSGATRLAKQFVCRAGGTVDWSLGWHTDEETLGSAIRSTAGGESP
jgi:hypothetical protein